MDDPIEDVKQRARRLHRRASAGDAAALLRLSVLPELAGLDELALRAAVLRRHALSVLASELGFRSWPHAKAVLSGDAVGDHGTLMHRESCGAITNIWSASYDEAKKIRGEHGGWLVAYRRHFLVVEAPFISHLGLDPEHEDWARIGRDWVRPGDRRAWARITSAAVRARLAS